MKPPASIALWEPEGATTKAVILMIISPALPGFEAPHMQSLLRVQLQIASQGTCNIFLRRV